MKTKQANDNVFDITLTENELRMKKLSKNRLPWSLRVASNVEKWILRKLYHLDPSAERIVRIYTYNDEKGEDFDFKCPNYTFDMDSCLYDDFSEASCEIGSQLQKQYGILGKYYYDVKITLIYERTGNPVNGYEWDMDFNWKILKTDNPRCVLGNPANSKDCYYMTNFNSKLIIDGYTLSGNYRKMVDVLNDLINKSIIVHSKSDAKALLRIMKFLGVDSVKAGKETHYNNPARRCYFSNNTFAYQLDRIDGETTMVALPKRYLPVDDVQSILDIDEFIVKRSLKARLRDRR